MKKKTENSTTSKIYFRCRGGILPGLIMLLLLVFLAFPIFQSGFHVIPMVIWILVFLFLMFLWFGTHYTIQNSILFLRMGPFVSSTIHIQEILSINRIYSGDNRNSFSLSFKRLKINTGDREIMVSPANENDFISELKKVNPRIFNGIRVGEEKKEPFLIRLIHSTM